MPIGREHLIEGLDGLTCMSGQDLRQIDMGLIGPAIENVGSAGEYLLGRIHCFPCLSDSGHALF
jgi:hypothetical protein